MDDNYSLWERRERDAERWLAKLPVCDYCEQHIQDDHYYEIDGEIICPDCLESYFRKENEL